MISNQQPRRDTSGQIMDIHDGNTVLQDGVYYYYGASYGSCKEPSGSNGCADFGVGNCGFRLDHNVSVFTSKDLSSWTSHAPIFQFLKDHPIPGIMFCPKMLFNKKTSNWVLWYNWIDVKFGFAASYYAVAVSKTPLGPFKVVNPNVTTLAWSDTGDFALFSDDDGAGYIIYTSHIQGPWSQTHTMSVEQLTDDYTATRGMSRNSGFFGDTFVEAPTMFKRNNKYYAVFGHCCCYCGQGSPVKAYVASHPLGPYSQGTPLTDTSIPAQQTNVLEYDSPTGKQFLWQGDRWQSAPDGIKGHDFSYWGPFNFDSQGTPQPISWVNQFTINVQ